MKKIFKKSIIALMVVLFSATLAMAGKGNGNPNTSPGDCTPNPYNHSTNK